MRLVARSSIIALSWLVAACGGSSSPSSRPAAPPLPEQRPLASLASTGAIVAPTFALRTAGDAAWTTQFTSRGDVLRALDADIAAALAERGLKKNWVLPPDLAVTYKRNPTYASDPYSLAEEPLRSSTFIAGTRLTEPLASQLRTMIALHENARVVLLPVELRLDPVPPGNEARATLRLVLVDPRFSEARWVGAVKSDSTSANPTVLTRAVARAVADLIVSR
jgi:hypothetical protein